MLWSLLVGIVLGWISGRMSQGTESIFWTNITVGIIGAIIGGFIFKGLELGGGAIGLIIASAVGAGAFLWLLKAVVHSR